MVVGAVAEVASVVVTVEDEVRSFMTDAFSHFSLPSFLVFFQAAVEADSVVTEEAGVVVVVDLVETVEDEAEAEAVVEARLVDEVVVVEHREAVVRRGVDVEALVSVERVPEL